MENLITLNTLRNSASSALTESKSPTLVKDTYGFINTIDIVNSFERQGWMLDSAKQAKTKTLERQGYQKHLLRFRHDKIKWIDGLSASNRSVPELIVENSHDGTSALRLFFGVFRIACLNGIIAGSTMSSIRVIHSINSIKNLDNAIDDMTGNIPTLIAKVNHFSQIELNDEKRIELARKASALRLENTKNVTDIDLRGVLDARRINDTGIDAYSVFNVVQEKVIRGGIRYLQTSEKDNYLHRKTTRPINSVSQSVKLNRELWDILEEITA